MFIKTQVFFSLFVVNWDFKREVLDVSWVAYSPVPAHFLLSLQKNRLGFGEPLEGIILNSAFPKEINSGNRGASAKAFGFDNSSQCWLELSKHNNSWIKWRKPMLNKVEKDKAQPTTCILLEEIWRAQGFIF